MVGQQGVSASVKVHAASNGGCGEARLLNGGWNQDRGLLVSSRRSDCEPGALAVENRIARARIKCVIRLLDGKKR